jgi:hypothetical protein
MNTFYCLLSVHAFGFLWLVVLFAVCFLAVHTFRLARLGRKYQKQRNHTPPPNTAQEKKTPPQSEGEPIYYIVERKRRAKSSYSEPKRIHFK